jgi:hypothetical protein
MLDDLVTPAMCSHVVAALPSMTRGVSLCAGIGRVFAAMSRQAFRDNTCVWFRTVVTVTAAERTLTNACPVRHGLALRDLCARYCGTASCVSV